MGMKAQRSNSVERHLFNASHPKRPRCSSRQINTTSLYEGTAVIDPDSASSALLGCNCDMGAEGLRAMSSSHCSRNHPLAGCGSTAAIAIMRGNACLGKYGGRCKGKSQSNKYGSDHSPTFHDLPRCVTLHHPRSSVRLVAARPKICERSSPHCREVMRRTLTVAWRRAAPHPVCSVGARHAKRSQNTALRPPAGRGCGRLFAGLN